MERSWDRAVLYGMDAMLPAVNLRALFATVAISTLAAGCNSVPRGELDRARDHGADLQSRLDHANQSIVRLEGDVNKGKTVAERIEKQLASQQDAQQIYEKRVENL